MWRIFDNLLNNVYKYAKEDTRVYVQTTYSNDVCSIVLKNVSKNKLNITKEELRERFVRGDESRNTEGNGLGLSIIKGFTEALGGTYDIIIDGDLFKTVLEFKF
ncbi:MAG: GHKL domain-containing protein [Lachnospiraceae bacterium]|nr:GHKL domain-containing protein [Lachnospiraceae bacterium]